MLTLSISPELLATWLQWLVIAIVWLVLVWGIYREDRRIRSLKNAPIAPAEMASLLQMLHTRHIQTAVLVTLLLTAQATNDLRHAAESAPAAALAAIAPIPAPEQAPAPAPAIPAKVLAATDLPFSDITEFNEKNSKEQVYLDWLKQRYEAWLVTYYYLSKCSQTGPQDLLLIEASLKKELDNTNADAKLLDNIMVAASGSYKEMYQDIPCDSRRVSATKTVYDENMRALNQPAPGTDTKTSQEKPPLTSR